MAKPKKSAAEGVGRLILHRFCGEEEYALTTAETDAYPAHKGEGVRLWFTAETDGTCVRSQPGTGKHSPRPNVRARVSLPALVPSDLAGRRFTPTDEAKR